ncbi:hypothetical protein [Streptomyces sp. URMC 123]|uniref:hypothetical protein n=1 Tax=Streptomyces sp. URMC 123 TaxID=3423403 RepID=UPI003F1A1C91
MSIRKMSVSRSSLAITALAAGLALTVAGCGDGGSGDGDRKADPAAAKGSQQQKAAGSDEAAPEPSATIGELKGPDGVVLTLHSAVRDSGGFVTVQGSVTNRGSKPFTAINWRSSETEMKSKSSLSGASLVDKAGKKRYLVLRDTSGECLCSTGLAGIKPNESRPVFAQFPAPPASVTEVDFTLPTMPTVSIEIKG